jgi:hypothetical protein
MRIDPKIPTHLSQKFPSDFLLSILESGEFLAEVQTAVAPLSFVRHKFANDIPLPSQFPHPALEFRTPHHSMFGHFCPKVKREKSSRPPHLGVTEADAP